MLSIDKLLAAAEKGTYVWFPNQDGKIVCGKISDIVIRTRTTARVDLYDIKYHPDDTTTIAIIRHVENDHVYAEKQDCESDCIVSVRNAYCDSIHSVSDLFVFMRAHDINNDPIAYSAAFDKAKELGMLVADTNTNGDDVP